MTLLLAVVLLFARQENWDRVAELEKKAEEAEKAGRIDDQRKCLGEARALRALLYANVGRMDDARRAWNDALMYGWKGPMPEALADPAARRNNGHGLPPPQDEPWQEPIKPWKPPPRSMWEHFAWQPFGSSRNGSAHSLVHVPPFEEAVTLPRDTWHAHLSFEATLDRFTATEQGGQSEWQVDELTQIFEVDYSITNWIEVGLRFTTGELLAHAGNDIRIFQNNIQIVFQGDRIFSIESIIPRVKVAFSTSFIDFGALVEVKIPTAGTDSFLTAKTVDIAFSALVSKRIDDWGFHANFGIVIPAGEAKLFRDVTDFSTLPATNDFRTIFNFAVGVTWRVHPRFTIGAQFEGNTSPFQNIVVLDSASYAVIFHGRYEFDVNAFGSFALGSGGFADLGPDFYFSLGMDFVF